MPQDLTPLLTEIQASNARQLLADRETLRVGPLLAAFHPTSDMVWLNYATPVEPTGDDSRTAEVLKTLRIAFTERSRTLRFEFIEALHPHLSAALESLGLTLQLRGLLMVCGPHDLRPCPAAGIAIRDLNSAADDDSLAELIRVVRRGFELDPVEPSPADIAEQRDLLQQQRQRAACAMLDGQMVGVGILQASAELAGLATLPEYRRRGAAAAVSTHLVLGHFTQGGQVAWLSAGNEAARGVYAKIGFADAGAVLNYIDPLRGR